MICNTICKGYTKDFLTFKCLRKQFAQMQLLQTCFWDLNLHGKRKLLSPLGELLNIMLQEIKELADLCTFYLVTKGPGITQI